MKIVVFNGSPKGKMGNTDQLVQAFLRGAANAGADVETVYLIDQEIHHCSGCFVCWFQTPGRCVHRDAMDALLPQYLAADIVCFATPVYTWNMTACLKNFVDRLAPLKSPLLSQQEGHYDLQDREAKTAQFVVLANAGFPGAHNFDTMRAVFASSNPVLEVYCNCGMALKKDNPSVHEYLGAVKRAGQQLVSNGRVENAVLARLEAPLMPDEEYRNMLGM